MRRFDPGGLLAPPYPTYTDTYLRNLLRSLQKILRTKMIILKGSEFVHTQLSWNTYATSYRFFPLLMRIGHLSEINTVTDVYLPQKDQAS